MKADPGCFMAGNSPALAAGEYDWLVVTSVRIAKMLDDFIES